MCCPRKLGNYETTTENIKTTTNYIESNSISLIPSTTSIVPTTVSYPISSESSNIQSLIPSVLPHVENYVNEGGIYAILFASVLLFLSNMSI